MKLLVANLIALVLALCAAVVWLALPETLSVAEVAKATGLKYWRYRVPDNYQSSQVIGLEITGPDGVRHMGGGGGYRPGETLKVFMMPVGDGSLIRWTVIGHNSTVTSTMENPCKELRIIEHAPDGSWLQDGVLVVGSDNSVSMQYPKPSDTVVRFAVMK